METWATSTLIRKFSISHIQNTNHLPLTRNQRTHPCGCCHFPISKEMKFHRIIITIIKDHLKDVCSRRMTFQELIERSYEMNKEKNNS